MQAITAIQISRETDAIGRPILHGMKQVEKAIALPVRRFVPSSQLAFGAAIAVSGLSVLAGKLLALA